MTALIAGLPGGAEWVILLVVALLLFGGTRLAGMGKGAGRAIREFREEVKAPEVEAKKKDEPAEDPAVLDAEVVEPAKAEPVSPEPGRSA
ncbi:MAG: twin-arginine translocase TatA/TatE family subunit [Actinomycetia bacterium]|nr:twin-arginine translocase TatA/TatE family subunit [Actinomycetes bacterium]